MIFTSFDSWLKILKNRQEKVKVLPYLRLKQHKINCFSSSSWITISFTKTRTFKIYSNKRIDRSVSGLQTIARRKSSHRARAQEFNQNTHHSFHIQKTRRNTSCSRSTTCKEVKEGCVLSNLC